MYNINLYPEGEQKRENEKSPFRKQLDLWVETYEEFPVDEVLDQIVEAVFNEIMDRDGEAAVYEDVKDMLYPVDWEREFWERLTIKMRQQIDMEKQGPWDVAARAIDEACIALRGAEAGLREIRIGRGEEIHVRRSRVRAALNKVLDLLGFGR
jgi:hypothetical protein